MAMLNNQMVYVCVYTYGYDTDIFYTHINVHICIIIYTHT